MKLNNKGYMLVEIIVSFSIAMAIAFYLINLTYKFKDNSDEIYQSSLYMKDKIAITKNIMNDLGSRVITDVECSSVSVSMDIEEEDQEGKLINKRILLAIDWENRRILYGLLGIGGYDENDISYYEKEVESTLQIGDISCKINNNNAFSIIIPLTSIYSSEDHYDVKLVGFLKNNS